MPLDARVPCNLFGRINFASHNLPVNSARDVQKCLKFNVPNKYLILSTLYLGNELF